MTTPPGDGSTVTAITCLTLAPPPAKEQNAAWQAVNKALNATLQMDQVSAADYPAKVNVVISGADRPDVIYNPTVGPPMMYRPDMFEKVGIQVDKAPKDADDFKRMLQAVTRPQDNQ